MTQENNTPATPAPMPRDVPMVQRAIRTAQQTGATFNAPIEPNRYSYWEDPQRVVRYRNMLRSAPPDFEPPSWIDRDQIEQAYQYMKFRNNDRPSHEWKFLADDDPGTSFLRGMPEPPEQFKPAYEQDWTKVNAPEPADQPVDWSQLDLWQQITLGILSPGDPTDGIEGRPWYTRASAAGVQGLMAALPTAGVVSMVGTPVAGSIAGLAVGGAVAYQAYTGNKVPIIGDALVVFDLLSMGTNRAIGLIDQTRNEGLSAVMQDLPAAWAAAQLNHAVSPFDPTNLIAMAAHAETAGAGEVWQLERGFKDPQKLASGKYGQVRGAAAMREARLRIMQGEPEEQVIADILQRFGTSGTIADFVYGSLLDPSPLLPNIGGRVAGRLADMGGNQRLAAAFREGVGNPAADVISNVPFLGSMVNHLLGLRESDGLIQSAEKYRSWIRTAYFPEGTNRVDASHLSSFEKWAGGLDEQGRIKELLPQERRSLWGYLTSLTPEAQAHSFMTMIHDNINVLLSTANSDPRRMVSILRQAARVDPVDVAGVGSAVLDSPVTVTIAQALRDVLAENWDQEQLLRWEESAPQRAMLEKVATALGETAGDILEQYKDNPQTLMRRIEAAGGPGGNPAQLKAVFDIFTGEDPQPWNANQFQARLATMIFDKMDQAVANRYGLKPDHPVFRLSQTLKGMQSLLLLGFNPSYFINNQVNNMVTRAATGVFGYMTPRQVRTWLDRFGITPERMNEALDTATGRSTGGDPIASAKRGNDWIQKTYDVVTATNRKLGIFSRFSSAGERLESTSAFAIGMQKFWGRAWKRGKGLNKMHPALEAALDRAAPGVKELLYQAIEAGMNMQEVERAIYSDVLKPQVNGIIESAGRALFPDDPHKGTELLRATGIQDQLERELSNATTADEARAAISRVEEDLRNIVNENVKREIATRAEDTRVRVLSEGAPAILAELDGLADRVTRRAGANADSFSRVTGYVEQTLAGILKAVGRSNAQAKAITRVIAKAARALKKFDTARQKLTEQLAKTRDTAEQARIRGEIKKLHDDYVQVLRDTAAAVQKETGAQAAPAPEPQTPVMQALYQLATEHGMIDRSGRPVVRYLMNIINRYRPEGKKYTDPAAIPIAEARQILEQHAQRLAAQPDRLALDYDEIIKIADDGARQAELEANGMMTRRLMREQLAETFEANDAEVSAAMTILDYHADQVARRAGKTPSAATRDAWYATRIAQVLKDGDADAYNAYHQEQYGSMVAIHNIAADNLIRADALGGLPVPSIAVIRRESRHSQFGEISLVARRSVIDPQVDARNRVFDADVYSPRVPRPQYVQPSRLVTERIYDRFFDFDQGIDGWFSNDLWDALTMRPPAGSQDLRARFFTLFERHATPMLVFLKSKGIEIEPVRTAAINGSPVVTTNAWRSFIEANRAALEQAASLPVLAWMDSPIYKQFEAALKDAYREFYGADFDQAWKKYTSGTAGGVITSTEARTLIRDYDVAKDLPLRVDRSKTTAKALLALKNSGLRAEYQAWVKSLADEAYPEAVIEVSGKNVPFTLENVVAYMTTQDVIGGEGTNMGMGLARAHGAREFSSVADMRQAAARGELRTASDYKQAYANIQPTLSRFESLMDHLMAVSFERYSFEAGMKVIAEYLKGGRDHSPERMTKAFEAIGVTDGELRPEDIALAIDTADAVLSIGTDYFEAKPQRAVRLEEFAGAVVPDTADPAVFEILRRRGIEYRTYEAGDEAGRQRAVQEFYNTDGVLFQGHHQGKRGQITMPHDVLVDNARKIRELGFIPAEMVAPVFAGPTPAYLREIARFIMERRQRYLNGQMTVRDVAKAYLITVSSQGSDALPIETVLKSFAANGLRLERNGVPMDLTRYTHKTKRTETRGRGKNKQTVERVVETIRPEEVAGLWLLSDQGKAALDALERGEITDAWLTYVQGRKPFGRFGRGRRFTEVDGKRVYLEVEGEWFTKRGKTSKFNLRQIQEVTNQINAARGDPAKIRQAVTQLAGIADGKAGFLKHMIGFADETTFDTQQANFWRAYLNEAGFDPKLTETLQWGNWGQEGVIDQFKSMVEDVYWQLRAQGVAADIAPEAFVHIMHHWLWDYQKGKESPHTAMYEALRLAQQTKGAVHFLRDGRAVIRAMEAPDVSTMVHEIGHIFRRDLSDADLDIVAQIGGLQDGAELKELEARFRRGEIMPGDPEYKAYVDAEEYFARAWERYLVEGDAPAPELRGVFERFTDFMLNIYKSLRRRWDSARGVERIENFDQERDFMVGGRVVNVNATINGRSLKDIFDELLVERRTEPEDSYTTVPSQTEAPAPRDPKRQALLEQPVKNLPEPVRRALADVAQVLMSELATSRTYLVKYTDIEGGAEVTKYRREWEGPYWWRQIIDSAERAGQSTDDLKQQYMQQLKSIVSGRDTGKAFIGPEVKAMLLERATSEDVRDAIPAPALLRYLGENERLFSEYGDQMLSSEQPALERMFGDEWETVLDELILWMGDKETGNEADIEIAPAQVDIEGAPVDGLAQQAAAQAEISAERKRSALRQQAHAIDQGITSDQHIVNVVRKYTKHTPEGIDDVTGDMLTEALAERQARRDQQPGLFQVAGPQVKTDTPAFRRWFGDSKAVDENGKPLRLYHGTLMDFDTFRGGSPEGYWGAGYYFTNSAADASLYASTGGPDWSSKIANTMDDVTGAIDDWDAEQIASVIREPVTVVQKWIDKGILEDAITPERARLISMHLLGIQNEGNVMPVYVKMERPLDMTGRNDERLTYELIEDENGDYVDERGTAVEFIERIRSVAADFDADGDQIVTGLLNKIDLIDGVTVQELFTVLRDLEEINFIEGEWNGDYTLLGSEFLRALAEDLGYDGVIMDAWGAFGPSKRRKNAMEGIDENTRHYIVFGPRQIKSEFNRGTFDPEDANILRQATGEDTPDTPRDLFGNPVNEFRLERQQAQAQEFNPQEQAQQGELFNRREYIKTIKAKKAKDTGAQLGSEQQPSLFSAEGNVPPGGTPAPEPFGSMLDEVVFEQVQPLLKEIERQYTAGLGQRKIKLGNLDEKTQADLRAYMRQVENDMASTKYAAMSYGQQMRDSALLNYNRRYGFDQIMEIMFPYQFWFTRSMVEWSKRMIDKPSWFAMYARLQEAQERTEANMPARLKGKMRLPAPWLPEWAGGGLWFDPMGKFMPFTSFGQPMENFINNVSRAESSASSILRDWADNERITQAEARQAIETKSGPVWDRAMKQAEIENDTQANPAGFASLMFSPSLFWSVGKNIAGGTPEKISPLPITRTASALETATAGTPLDPLGKLAGLAAWPEKAARKAAGLNEFGEWGAWYVDRQIANMAAEGLISAEQASTAMIEREGNPIYEDARARVQYEQMLQVPGAAFLSQLAGGDVEGALQAAPTLIFNGSLLPEGELKMRGLADEFKRAMQARDRGDSEAVNKFFAEHPEYEARLALNDEPQDRLRQFLISEVWERYSELERPNRSLAADQLGPQFRDAFLNKTTRAYDAIPVEVLARWSQMLGGALPQTDETAPLIEQPEPPVELYGPEMTKGIEAYQDERNQKFPNYYAQQQAYYSVPQNDKAGRKRILQRFPELRGYWDWKRQYKAEHPELKDYFDGVVAERARARGEGLSQQEIQSLDPILLRQVLAAEVAGQPLTAGAHKMLKSLADKKGIDAQLYQQMVINTLIPPVTR